MKDRAGNPELALRVVIGLAWLAGFGYMLLRYRPAGGALIEQLAVGALAGALYLCATLFVYRACRTALSGQSPARPFAGERLALIVVGMILLALMASALSRRMWAGLVALDDLGRNGRIYHVWAADGTSSIVKDLPHRKAYRSGTRQRTSSA